MLVDPITSLADLEFKAKTNDYYKQLAIIGCNDFGYPIRLYTTALKKLHVISKQINDGSCEYIVREVNYCRARLVKDFIIKQPKKRIRKKKEV